MTNKEETQTEITAREVLNYVLNHLGLNIGKGFLDVTQKDYNIMIKEIKFLMETS